MESGLPPVLAFLNVVARSSSSAKSRNASMSILAAHFRHLGHAFAHVFLILELDDLIHSHDVPASVESRRTWVGEIGTQLLSRLRIGKSFLARVHVREHQAFPRRKLIEGLRVLERERPVIRHGMGAQINAVPRAKDGNHCVELLRPPCRRSRAIHHTLPNHWALSASSDLLVHFKMFATVLPQSQLDRTCIQLAQRIAQTEQFLVVGQAAADRLAVLAHVSLVAVR